MPLIVLFFISLPLIAQKAAKYNDVISLSKSADQNVATLNAYPDALVSGNMAQAGTYLAADYLEYSPGHEEPFTRE